MRHPVLLSLMFSTTVSMSAPLRVQCNLWWESVWNGSFFTGNTLDQGCVECSAFRPAPYQYDSDIKRDGPNAFVIGGVNSDEVISKMTGITGVSLYILQARAQPVGGTSVPSAIDAVSAVAGKWRGSDRLHMRKSGEGFLREGQSLQEVLLSDNQVVRMLHTTHQDIANHLLTPMERFESTQEKRFEYTDESGRKFMFEASEPGGSYGARYTVKLVNGKPTVVKLKGGWKSGWVDEGIQGSFFNDSLFSQYHFKITDVETGRVLKMDALTPHLIYRYGFYQGGPYRIAPSKIVNFFKGKATEDVGGGN